MSRKSTSFDIETLFKLTRYLKKKGKRIVFTHGAFDLFHLGHLELLQKSADIAD
ncbi:MAG TPA: adenylyltransferase/cytidyltransferase family protein [Candidatus Dojkabacteria bacterium]|nr:adenylyltransferase/cytidyltransferase family protein [Candidatus Dojkabacteria bacterium]